MNKKENSQTNMFRAVSLVFARFVQFVTAIPALKKQADTLNANIVTIEKSDQVKSVNTTGVTSNKENVRDLLQDQLLVISSMLYNYASDKDNHELMAHSDLSQTSLDRLSQGKLVTQAITLIEDTGKFADHLTEYGYMPELLTRSTELLGLFETSIPAHRDIIVGKSVATDNIGEVVKETRAMLNDRADRLMVQFKNTQPDFYNEYQKARIVVHPGVNHKKTEATGIK